MKRVGYIFESICSTDNILEAIKKASKGKKKSGVVRRINSNPQKYAQKIKQMLLSGSYHPCEYIKASYYDTKRKKTRDIDKPKFYPDQIIHWAIILQIEWIVRKSSYFYSCGNMKKRGPLFCKRYIQQNIRHKFKATKYYLQLDIKKFYPSISPKLIITQLKRKIKDKKVIYLLKKILCKEDRLPIGILLSMTLSNLFLEPLDNFIKQKLKISYYTRYVDDILLFSSNKRQLHKARKQIASFIKGLGLNLKGNWQVNRTDNGLTYIGYRFFRHKTILIKQTMLDISRKVKRIFKRNSWNFHNCQSIVSYLGILRHCNCYNFYLTQIKPYLISMKKIKQIIRRKNHCENIQITKRCQTA